MKNVKYLILTLLLSSCGESPEERCTNENGHKWNKWQEVAKPKEYGAGWILSKRNCEHCGKIQTDSTRL